MPEEESIGHIIETYQRIEITEHNIYKRLARSVKDPENSKILDQIAEDELRHYADWEKYSQRKIKPNIWQVWKYYLISRIFGFTFGIKLMERGEENAQENYGRLKGKIPDIDKWIHDEEVHEQKLLAMLDEERLRYAGSVVLGLPSTFIEFLAIFYIPALNCGKIKIIKQEDDLTPLFFSLSA